jgi:phospholipid-binding lipoprotein MlaA
MKRILLLVLLVTIPLGRDAAWAVQKNASKVSVDLLNDDYLNDAQTSGSSISDPLEPMNRVFFEFNDKLYFWVLKPVNKGYSALVAPDFRLCFENFFDNLASPISFLNNILQGRFRDAWIVLSRFAINSTLGVFGFGDPATKDFKITSRPADFGQTLGVWGFGEGIYLCLPVFGPSNVRDSIGLGTDFMTHPVNFMGLDLTERGAYYMGERLNTLSLNPNVYEDMIKYSIDPYVATRQAFHDYRQAKIEKHKTPEE